MSGSHPPHLLYWLLLGVAALVAAEAHAAAIPEDLKKIITFIFVAGPSGELAEDPKTHHPLAYGTGFFVSFENDVGGPGAFGYLVTAKHVLKDAGGNTFSRIYVRLNKRDGDAQFIPVDIAQGADNQAFLDADPSVDLAIIPAYPDPKVYDYKSIPMDMLLSDSKIPEGIGEGSDVLFVGLFTVYYGEHRNIPIVRYGRVAMLPEDAIPWQDGPNSVSQSSKLYLIDTQAYGGNSGSPLFYMPDIIRIGPEPPTLKLLGVVRGHFNDTGPSLGVFQTPTANYPFTLPNNGIAAVTPSYYLYDLLFSDPVRQFRIAHRVLSDTPPK